MKWAALLVAVALCGFAGRLWQRTRHHGYRDVNDDSARRRLEALSRVEWKR